MLGVADRVAREHLRLVRVKEDFISSACPFHKGGQEAHPSFWINRHSGEWGCFSCSAKGRSLKTLLRELGIRNTKVEAEIDAYQEEAKETRKILKAKAQKKSRATFKGECVLPESVLGVFDFAPRPLLDDGFDKDLLRAHDIGFDKRYLRITFPIRDVFGNLIGISGRSVDGALPKYKVYEGTRMVEGRKIEGELSEWFPWYSSTGIRNHLWRAHTFYDDVLKETSEHVIIVEGYKAALWMVQNGWFNTVALMGSKMSRAQERLIFKLGTPVWVLLDNNRPGREGSLEISRKLARGTFPVYECRYPTEVDDAAQPDDLSPEALEDMLSTAKRVGGRQYGDRV